MNNNYGSLVPANTKKSMLWFGILRPLPDALILGSGVLLTIIALLIVGNASVWVLLLVCMPMLLAVLLVMPIPNYHNTLVAIQSIIRFYSERRNYIWKGWCAIDEYKNSK